MAKKNRPINKLEPWFASQFEKDHADEKDLSMILGQMKQRVQMSPIHKTHHNIRVDENWKAFLNNLKKPPVKQETLYEKVWFKCIEANRLGVCGVSVEEVNFHNDSIKPKYKNLSSDEIKQIQKLELLTANKKQSRNTMADEIIAAIKRCSYFGTQGTQVIEMIPADKGFEFKTRPFDPAEIEDLQLKYKFARSNNINDISQRIIEKRLEKGLKTHGPEDLDDDEVSDLLKEFES